MLLDCDGLPGAEGSGLAGSAGSAALSLGRVCVNQPFLVYCRVVGNPKRPVTLTAVHLQLVRPSPWVRGWWRAVVCLTPWWRQVDSGVVRVLSSPQEIQALVPAGGVGACLSHAAHASSPQPRLTVVVVVVVVVVWLWLRLWVRLSGGSELRQGDVFCVCVRLMVTQPCVDLKPGTVRLQWRSNCCTSVAGSPLSTVVAFPPLSCTAPAIEGEFSTPLVGA